ncbi:MAG: hypothetical protein ACRETW_09870 [Stenotrophobium sp.]
MPSVPPPSSASAAAPAATIPEAIPPRITAPAKPAQVERTAAQPVPVEPESPASAAIITEAQPPLIYAGPQVVQQIVFAKRSSDLPAQSLAELHRSSPQLQRALQQDARMRVEVVSYTDVSGDGAQAADVADARAWKVHAALAALDLPATRLRVVIPALNDIPSAQTAGTVIIRLRRGRD